MPSVQFMTITTRMATRRQIMFVPCVMSAANTQRAPIQVVVIVLAPFILRGTFHFAHSVMAFMQHVTIAVVHVTSPANIGPRIVPRQPRMPRPKYTVIAHHDCHNGRSWRRYRRRVHSVTRHRIDPRNIFVAAANRLAIIVLSIAHGSIRNHRIIL